MFKRFFTVAAVAMLFAACQVVEVEVESIPGQNSGPVTIGAIYEPIESLGTKSDITIDKAAKELAALGEELGVVIRCQHEDIFNMMHRV